MDWGKLLLNFQVGNRDFWIVKLNDIGTIQWQKTLGGSAYDSAKSIQQTTDGGYIVSGFTASTNGDITGYHGNGDYWIVKLNAVGTIQIMSISVFRAKKAT